MFSILGTKKRRPTYDRGAQKSPQTQTAELYKSVKKLRDGGQGRVCVVKRVSDGKVLVRKEQKKYSMFGDLPYEMYLLENVLTPHPRILEFVSGNYLKANNALVQYFEYCEGGDLLHYMPGPGERGPSEPFMWDCFIQLAEAIAFLHFGYRSFAKDPDTPPRGWARVVHRDIKPDNVFLRHKITSKHQVTKFVLGDFGLATLESQSYGAGTDIWLGPEMPLCTKQGDVWGVGATIHALGHGRGPVPRAPSDWSTRKWEASPQARQPKELPTYYSSQLNRNMMNCLRRSPSSRVDSLDLLKHLKKECPRLQR